MPFYAEIRFRKSVLSSFLQAKLSMQRVNRATNTNSDQLSTRTLVFFPTDDITSTVVTISFRIAKKDNISTITTQKMPSLLVFYPAKLP